MPIEFFEIGGFQLPAGLVISEPYLQTGVKNVTEPALDGTPLQWSGEWNFKSLIVQGTETIGTIKKFELDHLFKMASFPGAFYIFKSSSTGEIVTSYMNEDPPAISAIPLHPGSTDPNSVSHSLVIKLRIF